MGYMIEISSEKQGRMMEHAVKAYEHIGKMLDCIEEMGRGSNFGMRQGGGNGGSYGERMGGDYGRFGDDQGMGERRSRGGRYSMGYRENYPYYMPY